LFSYVNLEFTSGNCYGIIGANGSGKSTLLKILSGELEPTTGEVFLKEHTRMSVLKQDHYAYDEYSVLDTIIMGNPRLYEIMVQKEALYAKEDFTTEDGVLVSVLEGEFAELNGWEAESEASRLLTGLGLRPELLYRQMSELDGKIKVKVLLAQALFGSPDILLLDEPTNNLDIASIDWLEEYLLDFPGTVIVVSHDMHFRNMVCTHIIDIDYSKVHLYVATMISGMNPVSLCKSSKGSRPRRTRTRLRSFKALLRGFRQTSQRQSRQPQERSCLKSSVLISCPSPPAVSLYRFPD
jgi:ATPase subunit of ABC transporter with duplicated ATPase domains